MKAKPVPIEQVLDDPDDSKLCSGIYHAIADHYKDSTPAREMPLEEQTVILVLDVDGAWGVGGFERVFWTDWPDDEYQTAVAAFERIGCNTMAASLRDTISLFPDARVPDNPELRLEFLRKSPQASLKKLDDGFMVEKEEDAKLAAYIRAHRSAYVHLGPVKQICYDGRHSYVGRGWKDDED